MTSIQKPPVRHPALQKNALGLTRRDYEGALSTLCAGCGHDSITAAITEACWQLSLEPQNVVKLSGIGCSSKTTAYFVSGGHGFNSVHGRMPSIAMGANAARSEEHTSELQSRGHLVCRLLLEKKKKKKKKTLKPKSKNTHNT